MKFGQVYEKPKGSGVWFARFPNGRKTATGRPSYTVRRVSSKAKGRAFLKEVFKAKRRGLTDGGPSRAQGGETVSELVKAYIDKAASEGRTEGTLTLYRITARMVAAEGLGGTLASQVGPDDVRRFLAWRRTHVAKRVKGTACESALGRGACSDGTLARDRGLLASMFNWAVREGRLRNNPMQHVAGIRKTETPRRPFEPEEARTFLDACDEYLRPLVLCGLYTGLGASEVLSLRWRDVSRSRGFIAVTRKKTGKLVEVPLHPHLAEELQGLREAQVKAGRWRADGHVFLSRKGEPYKGYPRNLWRRTLERAGLEGRGLNGPHCLRRTFASLYEGPIRDLSELLGHATIHTTALYLRGRSEAKRRAVEALDFTAPAAPPQSESETA